MLTNPIFPWKVPRLSGIICFDWFTFSKVSKVGSNFRFDVFGLFGLFGLFALFE